MATIAEMFIEIGADTSGFEKEISKLQTKFDAMALSMTTGTRGISAEFANLSPAAQNAFSKVKTAMESQRTAMKQFRERQLEIKAGFLDMALGAESFSGTNDEFIGKLQTLGAEQKKLTQEMQNNNNLAKTSFLQSVATMLNTSSQASQVIKTYAMMKNPIYSLNTGFLNMANRLQGVANAGAPAVLALKMLGPTANMYSLNSLTRQIGMGLQSYSMIAMGAMVAVGALFAGLNKAAAESVPGYKQAMDQMGASVREAFQPMVEVFAAVMVKIAEFITWVANLINKFNEAHPLLAKVIQGFLLLIPVLTLLLAPLAIGIGLFNGMSAAFSMIWTTIGPVITGLASMMGTVLIVAAAIAAFIGILVYLWKTNESFRDFIIDTWNKIKAAAQAAWNYIYNSVIVPVVNAIKEFVTQIFGQLKTWWDENSESFKKIAQVAWDFISTYIGTTIKTLVGTLKLLWDMISGAVSACWENIKGIISGAIEIITNIISLFTNLLTGNWSGAWESIKNIVDGQLKIISNLLGGAVNAILGLVKGLGDSIGGKFSEIATSFYNAGRGFIDQMVNGIQGAASKVLDTVANLAKKVRDYLPFSPAKVGPLSDLDKLDFGGPIEDSISRGLPKIQSAMANMLTMPTLSANLAMAGGGSNSMSRLNADRIRDTRQTIEVPVIVDGREVARATATHMGRELNKIASTKARASGNK